MDNESFKLLKEVAVQNSKEVYNDGLKPATIEAGDALSTLVGAFNNIVLYPVKKANLTFKYNLEQFKNQLNEKIEHIEPDNLIEPPLNISGPVLEGLKYTFENAEIREMFLNLLSSGMNKVQTAKTHPAYVETIKSLSTLDAQILSKFTNQKRLYPFGCITFELNNNRFYTDAMPDIFSDDFSNLAEPFLVSASLNNLSRLGLISIVNGGSIRNYNYNELEDNQYVKNRFHNYDILEPHEEVRLKISPGYMKLTDYGINFRNICIR